MLSTADERRFAAAKFAIFLVAFYLDRMGYFLGLSRSILNPPKNCPIFTFFGRLLYGSISLNSREET